MVGCLAMTTADYAVWADEALTIAQECFEAAAEVWPDDCAR